MEIDAIKMEGGMFSRLWEAELNPVSEARSCSVSVPNTRALHQCRLRATGDCRQLCCVLFV